MRLFVLLFTISACLMTGCVCKERAASERLTSEFCGNLQDLVAKNASVVTEGKVLKDVLSARTDYKLSYADLSDEVRRVGILSYHACTLFWSDKITPEDYTKLMVSASTPFMWLESQYPDLFKHLSDKGYTSTLVYLNSINYSGFPIEQRLSEMKNSPPMFLMTSFIEINLHQHDGNTYITQFPLPAIEQSLDNVVAKHLKPLSAVMPSIGQKLEKIGDLDKSVAQLDVKIKEAEAASQKLKETLNAGIRDIDGALGRVDSKFKGIDGKLTGVDNRLVSIEKHIDPVFTEVGYVLFDTGRWFMKKEEATRLRESLAPYIKTSSRFSISAYADPSGSRLTNSRLCRRRAEAVAQWIVNELGVPPARVTLMGLGATNRFSKLGDLKYNRRAAVFISSE